MGRLTKSNSSGYADGYSQEVVRMSLLQEYALKLRL